MDRKISDFKKILLFCNGSGQALLSRIDTKGNLSHEQLRGAACALNLAFGFSVIEYVLTHFAKSLVFNYGVIVAIPAIFYGLIDIFFPNDLELIRQNYNAYYNRTAFYIYCGCTILGVINVFLML